MRDRPLFGAARAATIVALCAGGAMSLVGCDKAATAPEKKSDAKPAAAPAADKPAGEKSCSAKGCDAKSCSGKSK